MLTMRAIGVCRKKATNISGAGHLRDATPQSKFCDIISHMKTKHLETLGTLAGIVGAFLVAVKLGNLGYPFFFVSSLCLMISAIAQKQKNFIALQSTFFVANVIGLFNYL